MSKNNKPNHNDAAEYLTRVEWENQQSQRRIPLPWRMVPKWRYRKVASASATYEKELKKVWRFAGITLAVVCTGIVYFLGGKIALPVLLLIFFFGIFFWLAIRDASREPRDDD